MDLLPGMAPPPITPDDPDRRADFGIRLGAFILDIVFILILGWFAKDLFTDIAANIWEEAKLQITVKQSEEFEELKAKGINIDQVSILTIAYTLAITFLSFLNYVLEGFLGFTLGKRLLGLVVCDRNGQADTRIRFARMSLKITPLLVSIIGSVLNNSAISSFSSILGIIYIIGCFYALTEKRQALHDLIVGSAVFRKSELT
jgi:uncharacterized RDD family membrane protein YckC